MRIDAVTVAGYTSIRDADVRLRPLNVLVGANGAGKSNFVRALELLGRIVDKDLQLYVGINGGPSALLHKPRAEKLTLKVESLGVRYEAVLRRTVDERLIFQDERITNRDETLGTGGGHYESILDARDDGDVVHLLRGVRVYHFHDTSASAPVKQFGPTADNLRLQSDAGNLAALLWRLQENRPAVYREISESVRRVAPFFRDFVLEPERTDEIRLRWRQVDSDTVFSAHQLSDGTLRFICLATLLLSPDLPHLVALDEPELGLHPFAIVQLAEMLRAASAESQVVVATQSVTLIDQLSLEDLIVVEREDGSSVFRRPSPDRLTAWLDEYSLGELWQKNLIGGRPRREVA
ncbi:AAA family ATPase [Phytohabitans sp. ZYX-F-186]|uniref:AAA family ATPase n=1 Tax=Phytohabitans maris TaxID=3071409 RepID=A0ABU0Z8A3_9ACTN|nr:AAA family ATPase [Phytohabitans sp. ZYX-F-186]MDQ7903288.1 AAA family ATPase [Phytohabitans sp. ZYX-F-186]